MQHVTNLAPSPEQEELALAFHSNVTKPLPVPSQLVTWDVNPVTIPVVVDEQLTQQIKRYADPSMFDRILNNLGAASTGINFIRRLSVVAGGAPVFQEPRTSNGQQGALHQELIAVMPLVQQTRRRFSAQFGTQGSDRIPDCTSINVTRNRTGDVGFGNPGGMCKTCPHDTFIDGIGRGCRERQAVFALTKDSPFPYYLDMSVYSERPIVEMLNSMSLASGVDYWQVVVRISLDTTPTRAGQTVAIFKAEPVGVIDSSDPDVVEGIKNLQKMCHMVLADFAKLVQSSKTVRLNEISDPQVIESTLMNSTSNMPVPAGMQAPTVQVPQPAQIPQPAQVAPPAPAPVVVETVQEMPWDNMTVNPENGEIIYSDPHNTNEF